jgi:signal transduction histidine kinase
MQYQHAGVMMSNLTGVRRLAGKQIVLNGHDGRSLQLRLAGACEDDSFDQALIRRAADGHGMANGAGSAGSLPLPQAQLFMAPPTALTLTNLDVVFPPGTRNELLTGLSHDLRTPMNAIIGFTYLLRQAEPAPIQAERLRIVADAADRLMTVLETMLTLAWMETAPPRLRCERFSLPALLHDVCARVDLEATARQVHVDVLCPGVPEWVRGDSTRVLQALFNYVVQAVRLTPHARVFLRARLMEEHDHNIKIRFEVEDTASRTFIEAPQVPPTSRMSTTEAPFQDASRTRPGTVITTYLAGLMGGEAGMQQAANDTRVFWFTACFDRDARSKSLHA